MEIEFLMRKYEFGLPGGATITMPYETYLQIHWKIKISLEAVTCNHNCADKDKCC